MMSKTARITRSFASLLLCAALLILSGAFPPVRAQTLEELREQYNELQEEIDKTSAELLKIQNEQNSNEKKLSALSAQAEAISGQLDVLNTEISSLNAEITVYDREIAALDKNIEETHGKIVDTQNDIDETEELIAQRLRATYMAGSASWVEILLESESVSSLLLRIQLLAAVTENDNALIDTLEAKTKELRDFETSLSNDRKEADGKRAVLLEKKSELDARALELTKKQNEHNANYLEIANIMSTLDKNNAAYQSQLQKQISQREAFQRQIDQMVMGGSTSGDGSSGNYESDGVMMWPVPYQRSYITAGYGYYDPFGTGSSFHPAIDIVVRDASGANISMGKNIVAAQSGVVLTKGYSQVGGNYLTIDHGDGYRTYYGHCSSILVSAGDKVTKGEVIAYMGNTGQVTGPHLHFQVMQVVDGSVVKLNPLNFVKAPN